MKLIDAIKLKGKPVEIPNCKRESLADFFVEMGFKTGAEIGVYRGDFTKYFCAAGLKMYAIDPWIAYYGAGRSENKQEKQNENFEIAKQTLSPYPNCTLVRKTSLEASLDFANNSLDFVYIDGDHRFMHIAQDLATWFDKVKSGGIISGHDYFCTDPWARNVICHVKPVVDAFIKAYGIDSFYIFGMDKTPSWMFVKP
ncbi:MAG: class I SAM-dependent methyltransferase [Patescibacteria group bacterium]|nr:class I SAM-dependent methyltransferase [Patescibacteria group bacterium]